MNTEPVVKIESLQKQFGFATVLKGVSLDIRAGSIVGLVGANGAGKSTLIRHMVGLYLPDQGTCTTLGCEAAKLGPRDLARIGYVHQEGKLIHWMAVAQIIRYVASCYPNWNTELERGYLSEFKLDENAIVMDLSPGQRQMLAIGAVVTGGTALRDLSLSTIIALVLKSWALLVGVLYTYSFQRDLVRE